MKLIKDLAKVTVAATLFLSLVSCGGEKPKDEGYQSLYPAPIENLMNGQYAQAICAVGIGNHPDKNIASKKAGIDADRKIVKQFNSEIANLEKDFTEAVNDKALQHFQQTTENFSLAQVNGIQAVKSIYKSTETGYEVYTLSVVNPSIMKDLIDQQKDALTEFKATKAYSDLESRVAKFKADQKAAMGQ